MKEAFEGADIVYPKSWASYSAMEERTKLYGEGDTHGIHRLEKQLLKENEKHIGLGNAQRKLMALTKDKKAHYTCIACLQI